MNEEDIKILENLKENVALFSGGWKPILKQEEKQALENIIKAYKADKYILKNYVKVNKELHKDLENLATKNKELEEDNKILENEHNTIFQKWKSIIEEKDYIPKSKIKEKIEELKNEDLEIYDTDSEDLIIAKYEQRAILDFLEELLQEGEKNGTK